MTERSAEQAPVDSRPRGQDNHQDTARIPLAERLQRRIAAADERRSNGQTTHETAHQASSRVLPPMPAELTPQRTEQRTEQRVEPQPVSQTAPAASAQATQTAPRPAPVEPTQRAAVSDNTTAVPVVPGRTAARRTPGAPARAPRRDRLRLSRIDPWSVMKVSFLLSIAFGIVTVVSVFLVWSVLGAAGVWDSINNTVSDTVSSGNNVSTFDITDYLGMSRVLGFTMLVSVIDVILITAIATLAAFLYNMAASLLGGIEVTLAEDA
jgi:hypothetical protein